MLTRLCLLDYSFVNLLYLTFCLYGQYQLLPLSSFVSWLFSHCAILIACASEYSFSYRSLVPMTLFLALRTLCLAYPPSLKSVRLPSTTITQVKQFVLRHLN